MNDALFPDGFQVVLALSSRFGGRFLGVSSYFDVFIKILVSCTSNGNHEIALCLQWSERWRI
jgi:hypothetical protein